jgi:hypothetical protein
MDELLQQPQRKTDMIRKTLLGLAAVAALGTAALAPTSASAWGFGHHHHGWGHGFGFGIYAPTVVAADCYLVKRVNRYGVVRTYKVCD